MSIEIAQLDKNKYNNHIEQSIYLCDISRSLQQGQRSNQGYTLMLHTYTPYLISLTSINFLHLTDSKIHHRQDFKGQGHYGKIKSQIKVTP